MLILCFFDSNITLLFISKTSLSSTVSHFLSKWLVVKNMVLKKLFCQKLFVTLSSISFDVMPPLMSGWQEPSCKVGLFESGVKDFIFFNTSSALDKKYNSSLKSAKRKKIDALDQSVLFKPFFVTAR